MVSKLTFTESPLYCNSRHMLHLINGIGELGKRQDTEYESLVRRETGNDDLIHK